MTQGAEAGGRPGSRRPVLVTGMPRSGTTWLARLLATGQGTALAGREPMNPRSGQYGLGRTLPGWARLEDLTPRQARDLRLAFRGLNPWVFSRYGRRQWAAPLPGVRVIVKDPFALLSVPTVLRATDARCVVLYRHPGAMLNSYRRMGWTADLDEVRPMFPEAPDIPAPSDAALSEAHDLALFWSLLYRAALADLTEQPGAVLISHQELASGGAPALRRLFGLLDLTWTPATERAFPAGNGGGGGEAATSRASAALHNFDRTPQQVATGWESRLDPAELAYVNEVTANLRGQLDEARSPLVEQG